jgi:hypothetical protein
MTAGPRPGDLSAAQCGGAVCQPAQAVARDRRGIATRYEKRVLNYRAMLVIAALVIWLPS